MEGVPQRGGPFGSLDSWERLESWFGEIVRATARAIAQAPSDAGAGLALQSIPPKGAMARELSRTILLRRRLLHRGLRKLARAGELSPAADPTRLASFAAAAVEGGVRLAHLEGSVTVLEHALAETLSHLRSYSRAATPVATPR